MESDRCASDAAEFITERRGMKRPIADVARGRRVFKVPVLMYHRIATDGPAELAEYRVAPQMLGHHLRFLRRRGFRSISIEEWQADANGSGSLFGRPIMLTFDDAYLDFYETAWPILRESGFSAYVFVVTDKVGKTSDWDNKYGDPAPLMTWQQIKELASAGVRYGSHLSTHTRANFLSSEALLREAVHSRAALEEALGLDVHAAAIPYGVTDSRVEEILGIAGYTRAFAAGGGYAPAHGLELSTPRIAISGADDILAFAEKLGLWKERPEAADLP